MRHVLCIVVVLSVCAVTATAGVSVTPSTDNEVVDPAQSAALFVGVREFAYDATLAEVPFGVDDAVDLAYVLAMDPATRIVQPDHVVLALSGQPVKPQSVRSLAALKTAGAEVHGAGQSDILTLLEKQADRAGVNGMLVVSFATHGVSEDGTQRLFASTSLLRHLETTVSEATVKDIVSQSRAERSLILIDACRRRLLRNGRDSVPDPRSRAALLRDLASVNGQVVFSAAAAGDYAYDNDVRHNGVFTAAVIDGLRCGAPPDARGYVTVGTLAPWVEERVLQWVQVNRNRQARRATQIQSEGRSREMPLSVCKAAMTH